MKKFKILNTKVEDEENKMYNKHALESEKIIQKPADISNIKNQIHSIQSSIEKNKLKKLIPKKKPEKILESGTKGSFIEKSAKVGKNEKTSFSLDSLAEKFSIDELKKIKSLIKFAKNNKILDLIYEKSGDVKMDKFLNQTATNPMPLNNLTLLTTNINLEITGLKKSINDQQQKLNNNLKQMQDNFVGFWNIINFMKEQNVEFQKSMLVFGSSLANLNGKVNNITAQINNFDNKISEVAKKVDLGRNEFTKFSFKEVHKKDKSSNFTGSTFNKMVESEVNNFLGAYSNLFINKIRNISGNEF